MQGHTLYRTLVSIVIVYIVLSIASFNFMSNNYFHALEKPYLDKEGLQLGEPAPGMGLYVLFGAVALFGAAWPFVASRRELSLVDFYLLVALFLILPVVYSKDTKENFLLVKETHLRIFLIGMFALWLYRRAAAGDWFERLKEIPRFAPTLLVLAIASIAWSVNPANSVIFAAILLSYLVYYLILGDALREKWQLVSLCNVAVAMAALDSAYGLLQYYGYDPLFGAGEVIGNVDRKRVFSFFGNPVFLGVYLDAIMPVSLAMFLYAFALRGDFVHTAERVIQRVSTAILAFCLAFPAIYVLVAKSLLSSRLGLTSLNALTQQQSVEVSKVMKDASQLALVFSLLGVGLLVAALELLRRSRDPLLLENDRRVNQGVIGLLGFLLIFACLVITFTRTAWIAAFVSLVVTLALVAWHANALVYRYRKPVLVAFFAILISGVALTGMYFNQGEVNWGTESISARLTSSFTVLQRMMLFDIAWKIWLDRPWHGFGLDTFEFCYPIYQEKFYTEGPFGLIPGANAFAALPPVRFLLNFLIYTFFMMNVSGLHLALVGLYLVGGASLVMLSVVYAGLVKRRETWFKIAAAFFLPLFLLLGLYHEDTAKGGNTILTVSYSDGTTRVIHGALSGTKPGDLKDPQGATDARVTAVRDMFLRPGDEPLSRRPLDYDWLAADFDNTHNEYLQVMDEIGIFGLAAYLLFFGFFFYEGALLLSALGDPSERLLVIGFLGGVVACLVESLANFPYHRLMPIIVTGLAFMVVRGGPRLFESVGGARTAAGETVPAPPLPATPAPPADRPEWFLPCLLVLLLVYFPMRFVSGNLLLKSGHVRMMEGVRYMQSLGGEQGQKVYQIMSETARLYLEEAIRQVPTLTEASFWLGEFYRTAGLPEEALKIFRQTLRHGNNKNVYTAIGSSHSDLAQRAQDPAEKARHMELAAAHWRRASTMNPNFSSPAMKLGQYYYGGGQYATAEVYLKRAIRFGETAPQAYELLASAQLLSGNTAEVTATLRNLRAALKAAGMAPRPMLLKLAETLLAERAYDEAYEVLVDHVNAHPGEKQALKALFDLSIDRKAYPAAREFLRRLYGSEPTKDYRIKLAALHELEGDLDRAYFELALAYQADTNDAQLLERMKRIEGLRKR